MEYFIGLTFDPGPIHHQKIESFRARFDSKFGKAKTLQLTILPPFSIDFKNKKEESEFIEEISDLLDSHLMGLMDIAQVQFNGMTFTMGNSGSLALTPMISPDFLHVQESLYSVLQDYGVKFKKTKDILTSILPIARVEHVGMLESAIEVAKVEFSSPFVLVAESIVLFEKTPREWKNKNNLYDFEVRDHFFFVNQIYA
jgi:hypothetical protein